MKGRFLALFEHAPVLFFAVVIGVALTFRVSIDAVRDLVKPEESVPVFVSGPEPGLPSMKTDAEARAAASATALPGAEVGAAAKVQPLGSSPPARVPRRRLGRSSPTKR
jgi:hypothetical protein